MLSATKVTASEAPPVVRWLALLTVSLAMFGNYYIYDSISPLADLLKAQLNFTDRDIGLLNAIYSIPNVFMVLIGGIVIDRIGTRKSLFIFTILCFLGSLVTVAKGDLGVMAAGRLLFGLGAESMIVAVTTALARWFKGRELSFAFGLNLTLARLGSFAALNSPTWASSLYSHWRLPLLLSAVAGLLSMVAAIGYWALEAQAERRYRIAAAETEKVRLSWIFTFPRPYYYIVALCVSFYSCIFPFQTFAIKFFIETRGVSRQEAGFLSSMLTLFAMFATPIFGLLADRIGKRATLMVWGSLLLVPVYLLMGYTSLNLFVPMAMMGVAFSLIPAVMWPSVAYLVEEARLGTAYGFMTMLQNVGLATFNLLIGWVNDLGGASALNPTGYRVGLWLFTLLAGVAVVSSWLLKQATKYPEAQLLETMKAKAKGTK